MSNENSISGKNINTGTNYGHIGDKYEGIKQRQFTNEDYQKLKKEINEFIGKYSDKINNSHITIGNPGDKESTLYCNQIANALIQDNIKVQFMTLMTFNGDHDKNFSISNAPDNTILIEVLSAPNI